MIGARLPTLYVFIYFCPLGSLAPRACQLSLPFGVRGKRLNIMGALHAGCRHEIGARPEQARVSANGAWEMLESRPLLDIRYLEGTGGSRIPTGSDARV
ncbi:hypothetical protein F5148DRAFT_1209381, partial [Russula earlei]